METVLRAKNMTKIYGLGSKQPFTALENIDLEIKTGEFIVVMGPSGSGKSTLVNNISTIDIPTNGSLYILNQEVKQMSENQLGKFRYQYLGFIFQNYNLLNSLTIYENIMIPITDGKRLYNISVNLKAAYETEGKEIVKSFEKAILLHTIDDAWKENLRELDELKHSVQNASYEQKDPLLIFKLESVNLFDNMVNKINNNTISVLTRGQIPVQEPEQVREAAPEPAAPRQQYREEKRDLSDPDQQAAAGHDTREVKREPVRAEKTVGRNDLCPCGSGKKYKNCHGKND